MGVVSVCAMVAIKSPKLCIKITRLAFKSGAETVPVIEKDVVLFR